MPRRRPTPPSKPISIFPEVLDEDEDEDDDYLSEDDEDEDEDDDEDDYLEEGPRAGRGRQISRYQDFKGCSCARCLKRNVPAREDSMERIMAIEDIIAPYMEDEDAEEEDDKNDSEEDENRHESETKKRRKDSNSVGTPTSVKCCKAGNSSENEYNSNMGVSDVALLLWNSTKQNDAAK
jgi:hypothetical protein